MDKQKIEQAKRVMEEELIEKILLKYLMWDSLGGKFILSQGGYDNLKEELAHALVGKVGKESRELKADEVTLEFFRKYLEMPGENLENLCVEIIRLKKVGKKITRSEMRTPEQMREYVMSVSDSYEEGQKGYGEAALWLAKQYLILLDEGFEGELYDEVKKRQGGRDMDFTGFMVGWAENAARYVKGKTEKSNPAIRSKMKGWLSIIWVCIKIFIRRK